MSATEQRIIEVWADWIEFGGARHLGILYATAPRAKETFSFEYDQDWFRSGSAQNLDPSLQLFAGPQYLGADRRNFGLFLDSAPDRWGRFLMDRRARQAERDEGRPRQTLRESDYLLGVFDEHRMGPCGSACRPTGRSWTTTVPMRHLPGRPFVSSNRPHWH